MDVWLAAYAMIETESSLEYDEPRVGILSMRDFDRTEALAHITLPGMVTVYLSYSIFRFLNLDDRRVRIFENVRSVSGYGYHIFKDCGR